MTQLYSSHCASATCALFHLKHQEERGPVFCRWCGDYVSLGPSNDADEVVQIEIRAAEIAAPERMALHDDSRSEHEQIDECEECAFWDELGDDVPTGPAQLAGWLASEIVSHGAGQLS